MGEEDPMGRVSTWKSKNEEGLAGNSYDSPGSTFTE